MASMIFKTDKGLEVPAITVEQMRKVDRIATEETGPNLLQMMENAGRNLAELALEKLGPNRQEARVAVLAGSGGNGGGGICAARHLANRGVDVWLCLSTLERLGEVPAFQRKIFCAGGGREVQIEALKKTRPALILDTLIGYSLHDTPLGLAKDLILWANTSGIPILSLDVPSGLEGTKGETPGVFIKPKWTLTLALPKTGLLPEKTGKLFLSDIGIPPAVYRKIGIMYENPFDYRFVIPLYVSL